MAESVPHLKSSETVYSGRVVSLRRDELVTARGHEMKRDVVVHPNCVCGVARFSDGRIILVRQYRHPAGEYLWELPAGKIDPGENPREAFERELIEEVGVGCGSVEEVCCFYTSPGILTERMHMFVADGCREGAGDVNPDEIAEWTAVSLDEAMAMIGRGEIVDGKSIVGLAYAARRA